MKQLQSLLNTIPNIVWTASLAGSITFLNRRWSEVTGLSCAQGLGFAFLEAIHPEDRDRIQVSWQQAVETQCPYEAEFRLRQANQTYHRVIAQARLELDNSENSSQKPEWVGTFTDIEAIANAQEDLVNDQHFLAALLENLSDGIVACDVKGTLTLFNSASQAFHGLPAEPLPVERWAEHYDLYGADKLLPLCKEEIPLFRALNGETVRGVKMRIVPKQGGKSRLLVASGTPIMHPDGHQIGAVVAMRDITEQEQAEAELKASERRFRAIFNQTFQFMGLLKPDGTLIEANQTVLDFGGVSAEEVIGKPFWEARWWGLSNEIRVKLQQAISLASAGELVRYEVEILGVNDEVISIDFSLKPIRDEMSNVVLLIAEGRDITQRKQAEAEVYWLNAQLEQRVTQRTAELEAKNYQNNLLLEGEQKARAEVEAANQQITTIWESMTDAYLTLDCDWRVVYTNSAATAIVRQLVGLAPQEVLGKTHWDVFPWSVGNIVEQEYRRAVANRVAVHFEVLYEPTETWFEIHAYPSTEGLGIYFQDISERKRIEAERIQAEQERDHFFNLSLDMLAIASFEGNFLSLNPAWEQTLGFTAAELMAQPSLDWVHPDDRAETLTAMQGLSEGQALIRFENRYRCKDGSYRWLLWSSRPYDEKNLVFAVAHDITERKQVEVRLQVSERKFSAIFEQTFELIGILSLDGILQEVNQAALDSISAQKLDLVGQYFWDTPWWHSQQLQNQLKDAIAQAACGQFIQYEVQSPNATGDLKITDFSLKPIFDEAGRVEMIIAEARDITERKQIETALRESEQRFHTLADHMSQFAWMAEASGWIFWYNHRWFDYTGTTLEQMQGWGWQQVHHPDHINRVVKHFRHQLEIGEEWEDTFPLRGKNGAYRWFLSRAIPIKDESGQVLRWFGTNTDITDRKQSEETLQASEQLKQRILESSKDCIKVLRLNTEISYISPGGLCLLEIDDPTSILNTVWINLWQGEDLEKAKAAVTAAKEGNTGQFQGYLPTAKGTPKWWDIIITPMRDTVGQIVQLVIVSRDITEARRNEADRQKSALALREAHGQLKSALAAGAIYVWRWNISTNRVIINEAFANLLGVDLASATTEGLSIESFINSMHPQDCSHVSSTIQKAVATGQLFKAEYRVHTASGEERWVTAQGRVECDAAGKPAAFPGASADITERKLAEFALQKKTYELTQTTALINQRNQELDQFAHIVSHDLKAPLRAISNLSQWIEEDLGDQVPLETKQNLDLLRARVFRMETLINGLLTYAKVGYEETPDEPFSLHELLLEIVDSLDVPPEFTVQLPSNLPTLTANRLLLSQVFTNLIGNAVKYHNRPDGKVQVTAQVQAQHYEFSVSDDGLGIASEHHSRIFEMFQTLTSQDRKDSTGIGLAIVKKVVERAGGKIFIESKLGEGAVFKFTWPIS